MAMNLDTAIRLSAQVTGLDQFKALGDRLLGVKAGSTDASTAFQQLSGEAARLTQESAKVAGGVKVQGAALQDLQVKARGTAAETKRAGAEMRGLGGILAGLRGQSAGVMDGLEQSTGRAADGIREFQRTLVPTDAELARVRDQLHQLAGASKTTEQSIKQQTEALKRLKSQAEVGGQLYRELTADIDRLGKAGREVGPAFEAGTRSAQQFGKATAGNREAIRQEIEGLQRLSKGLEGTGDAAEIVKGQLETLTAAAKREAVELGQAWEPGIRGLKLLAKASEETTRQQSSHMDKLKGVLAQAGEGYKSLGRQIQDLKAKAEGLDLSKGLTVGNVAQGAGSAIQSIVQMRRDLARSMTGRVVLTGEGLATAGVVGAAGAGIAAGVGGLAAEAQASAASFNAMAEKAAQLPNLLKPLSGFLSEPTAAAARGLDALASKAADLPGFFKPIGSALSDPTAAAARGLDSIADKAAQIPNLLKPVSGFLSEPAAAAANEMAQLSSNLTAAQGKLQALSAPFEAIGTAISSIGPEAAAAAGVASLAIAGVYQVLSKQADEAQADLERSFKGISDNAQQVLEQLVRIYDKVPAARLQAQEELRQRNLQRLSEVPADSIEARRAANAVAVAEREIAQIRGEQDRLLENARKQQQELQRQKQELQRMRASAAFAPTLALPAAGESSYQMMQERARQERRAAKIAQIEAIIPPSAGLVEAAPLNQAVEIARKRLELQREITAEAKKSHDWEWLRNRQAKARLGEEERLTAKLAAYQDDMRRKAAAAFPAPTVLALPAAGQTSFQGTVSAAGLGGGARARLQNFETAGTAQVVGAVMGTGAAGSNVAQAAGRTRGQLAELFLTIDRVTKSSNGSISSLQRQRSAWEALRLAVNPAAPAYAKATREVEALDKRLQALTGTQQKAQRQGIGREAFGSALGSLAAGGGLQGAVGALAGGLAFSGGAAGIAAGAAISATPFIFTKASEYETQARSLEILAGSAQRATQIIKELQQLGAVTPFTSAELIDAAKRLQAFGIQTEKVVDITRRLADVSGATGAELNGLVTAYGQVQAKGRLQGEELLQFQERGVALQVQLRKQYNLSQQEFQKALEGGRISAAGVEFALVQLTNAGGKYANGAIAQSDTLRGRMSTLQDSIDAVAREVGKVLTPATLQILRQLNESLSGMPRVVEDIGLAFNYVADQIKPFINGLEQVQWWFKNLTPPGWSFQAINNARETGGQIIGNLAARQRAVSGVTGIAGGERFGPVVPERLRAATGNQPPPLLSGRGGTTAGGAGSGTGSTAQPSIEDRIRRLPFGNEIIAAARANSLDPALFAALVGQESGYRAGAVSRSGAIGLAQLMPGTARELGVNPRDPLQNLMGGARYLRQQIERFGLEGGLRAYNQGPGAQMRTPGGNSRESRQYPGQVLARYRQLTGGEGMAELQAQASTDVLERRAKALEDATALTKELTAANSDLGDQIRAVGAAGAEAILGQYAGALKQVDRETEQAKARIEELWKASGGTLDRKPLQELIDRADELKRGLAETQRNQALIDLLPGLEDYNRQIKEAQQLTENRKNGIEGLTEVQKLNLQIELLGLEAIAATNPVLAQQIQLLREKAAALDGINKKEESTFGESFRDKVKSYTDSVKDLGSAFGTVAVDALGNLENTLTEFVTTGKLQFKEFVAGILKDLAQLSIRLAIVNTVKAIFPNAGFANGGAFTANGIVPFARGGVVDSPTLFQFANGGAMSTGVMGEAGPEAILPLKRNSRGQLGVTAESSSSGSPVTVNVAVDAKGTQVAGDSERGNQLGRVIAAAVRAEIIKQKRPGGVLA